MNMFAKEWSRNNLHDKGRGPDFQEMDYLAASAPFGKKESDKGVCFTATRSGFSFPGAYQMDPASPFDLVAVLAEGKNGLYGKEAGRTVVETARDLFSGGEYSRWIEECGAPFFQEDFSGLLREMVRRAHIRIARDAARRGALKTGSTAVILLAKGSRYWFAHIGESCLYHLSFSGGINRLPSCEQDGSAGTAGPSRRVLGCNIISPDFGGGRVSAGDVFILCSAGLSLDPPLSTSVLTESLMRPDSVCLKWMNSCLRPEREQTETAIVCVIRAVCSEKKKEALPPEKKRFRCAGLIEKARFFLGPVLLFLCGIRGGDV